MQRQKRLLLVFNALPDRDRWCLSPARRRAPVSRDRRRARDVARRSIQFTRALSGSGWRARTNGRRTMQHTNDDIHISDEELLLTSDGESSPERAAQVRAHVESCAKCRARMEAIEGAAADFSRAYRAAEYPEMPPPAASRANLQRRMTAISTESGTASRSGAGSIRSRCARGRTFLLPRFSRSRWRWVGCTAPPRKIAATSSRPRMPVVRSCPTRTSRRAPRGPSRKIRSASAGGPAERRPPLGIQKAVFHEYGMDTAPAREYEVDHLITPALGGTDDIRNLWPEPYTSTEWNAYVKDELEDHLHNLVCGGKLDLATAQRDMASNWILAYKKYFHADQPLPHTSDLIDDRAPQSEKARPLSSLAETAQSAGAARLQPREISPRRPDLRRESTIARLADLRSGAPSRSAHAAQGCRAGQETLRRVATPRR